MPDFKKVFATPFAHKKFPGLTFDREDDKCYTQPQFADDLDINDLVLRAENKQFLGITAKVPVFNTEFKPNQFEESLAQIRDAQNQFNELPSGIRERFDNDPAKLITFIGDDKNLGSAFDMGLIHYDGLSDNKKKFIDLYQGNNKLIYDNKVDYNTFGKPSIQVPPVVTPGGSPEVSTPAL